jgi:protein-tyrosine-phosphatase
MPPNPIIVFVCEHGAAKSIIAAAYFNKLAKEKDSALRATARGTNPDQELSPKVIDGLRADGLIPTESSPQPLSPADIESAQRIISFCELPEEFQNKIPVEQWADVPPVSEDYEKARDAIIEKIDQILK